MLSESVYLLNPPFVDGYCRDACWQASGRAGTFRYPIWLAYAAAQLVPYCQIKLVDAVANSWSIDTIIKDIRTHQPTKIVVDTNWGSLRNDLKIASTLRELFAPHGIEVIPFGIPFGTGDVELLKHVVGEDPENCPNVTPIYASFLDIPKYRLAECFHPVIQLWAHGVTCPQGCIFCNKIIRKVGFRDYQDAVDEVEFAMSGRKSIFDHWIADWEYPIAVKEFHYEDDDFTMDKFWAMRFCSEVMQRKLELVWSCQTRADVSGDLASSMSRSGCRLVICGFESGADSMLSRMKKGFTVNQTVKFAKSIRKSGILLQADVIIGLPSETKKTIDATRSLVRTISPDVLQVTVATPYPNTEFHAWAKERGYLLSEDPMKTLLSDGRQSCVINYPNLTAKEIKEAVDETLMSYYKSWRFAVRAVHQVCRKNGLEELKRLWWSTKQFKL